MESSINITAIVVANALGLMLVSIMFISNFWRLHEKSQKTKYLLLILLFTYIGCIVDPLVFIADGVPGKFAWNIVYWGNAILFMTFLLGCLCWLLFLKEFLHCSMSKLHALCIKVVVVFAFVLLAVNTCIPVVFQVDEQSVYSRSFGYWLFVAMDYGLLVDSLIYYLVCKHKGGVLKFFPVWIYLIPIAIGTIAQSMVYGISVLSASFAVAVTGVFASLQSEQIFRDGLTGLFNRVYLDYLLKRFSKKKSFDVTGLMIDLNGFKQINDTQGHAIGDVALKNTAKLLSESLRDIGVVMRYAGDEFVAFVNTTDETIVEKCVKNIQTNFDTFNKVSKEPYKLSTSIGWCVLNKNDIDNGFFMNEIDRRMYENKKNFYEQNAIDRRKRC